MDSKEIAIIEWVNTFETLPACSSIHELYSGRIIGLILSEIAPAYFEDVSSGLDSDDNWALSSSHIKKILRLLNEYFTNVLHKGIDMSAIDANAIAKNHNPEALLDLLEVVVGVAVMCEDKNVFIQNIFALEKESQIVLKEMVENVMHRTYDLEEDPGLDQSTGIGTISLELQRLQGQMRKLEAEKQSLSHLVDDLSKNNSALKKELEDLKEEEFRRAVNKDSDISRAQVVASIQAEMQKEIEELKEKLSTRQGEIEKLKNENISLSQRLESNEEIRARLEVEVLQQAEEIDIAKEKAAKLVKAEATIEKYQKKIESMSALKNQNKELEESLDKYVDQISELEKSIAISTKLVDQYKDKNIELERSKFEATSALEMKVNELGKLRSDLEAANDAKHFLEEELSSARNELEAIKVKLDDDSGFGMYETPAALKDKVRKLEAEVRALRHDTSGKSGSIEDASKIAMLNDELEREQRKNQDKDAALTTLRKQFHELQSEVIQLRSSVKHHEEEEAVHGGGHNAKDVAELNEFKEKYELKCNTVVHLENMLKESEAKFNKLEHDKEKLENFAKRSLMSFKEKYMTALQKYKNEKIGMEQKLQKLEDKLEKDQEIYRREERLMLSAMYEMGVRIMDRNILMQVQENAAAPTTFLASQRAEQDRRLSGPAGLATPTK